MTILNKIIPWLGPAYRLRFRFFLWPAAALGEQAQLWQSEPIGKPADRNSRFPLRMMRYWWTGCALQDEHRRLGRPLTVFDVGCGKGILRKYVGDSISARWVGLDMKLDRARLAAAGYDELYTCDFDQPLAVADASADAVAFLHVLEHVPRPDFTLSELVRILRPGGVLLAGSPVAPQWVARLRERWFQRQLRQGQRVAGNHINCFWPARWSAMVRTEGLNLEMLTGAYLLRWAGNPLENTQGWMRLNQLWGALFPSLGGEVYVMARSCSPAAPSRPQNSFIPGTPVSAATGGTSAARRQHQPAPAGEGPQPHLAGAKLPSEIGPGPLPPDAGDAGGDPGSVA